MKTVIARDLQKKKSGCVELSQEDGVVVARHGKPAAVLVGVKGKDWEDLGLQTSPAFWKFIEQRRKQRTVSFAELKSLLGHCFILHNLLVGKTALKSVKSTGCCSKPLR